MRVVCIFSMLCAAVSAQSFSPLNCIATAVPALVRAEGLAERVGDILLNCSGGTPNGIVRGDIRVISFSGNITNKLTPGTSALDAVLTVNTGSGEVATGATAQLRANNQFDFAGMNFTLGPAGTAVFRLSNIRVVPPQNTEQPFQFGLATNGPSAIRVDNSSLTVGIATRGLLASYSSAFVCTVSGLPSEITFNNLLASGTRFASMRFTEGFPESFIKRLAPADHGTRILVQLSNFPPGARIFAPDALAGSNASIPTAAGDLGLTPNGGSYNINSGQLALARVRGADVNGASGVLAFDPSAISGLVANFNAVSEVPLSNGTGTIAYEVVDSTPGTRESVQVPIFLALEQRPAGGTVTATVGASFGPISLDTMPSASPVPRYQAVNPPPDCQVLGDCNSSVFPRLVVDPDLLTYSMLVGQAPQTRYVRIRNGAGGLLNWSASIQYRTGSGWLSVEPPAGLGNGTIRLDASATGLAAGTYEASLVIDAGVLAGSVTLPVRLTASAPAPSPLLPPDLTSVVNAATFEGGPLAPGTIATAFGNRLRGDDVQVRVNGELARSFFGNDTQINFQVPPGLPDSGRVNVFVSVDTRNSPVRTLDLARASPGIFPNAVLNQDFSANAAANPAAAGSIVQLFLTGLPASGAPVTVKIHDYTVTPVYAGVAPGFLGLQQVNAEVPPLLQSITSSVAVCWGSVCSPSRPITVRGR